MGVIEDSQIDLVNERLKKICSDFKPFQLNITALSYTLTSKGDKSWQLNVNATEELKQIHRTIMEEFTDIVTYDVTIDMFNQDEEVDPVSITWIENYAKTHQKLEDFHAHFSLKCKKDVEFNDLPIKFTASRVVLCHLGNFCTCRTKFGEVVLKKSNPFPPNTIARIF